MQDALRYILKEMEQALEGIDPKAMDASIEAITSAKKIFIYGVGRSGLVGQAFAVRLVQLGFDVHFVGDMTTPIVDTKDLVFIVSNTGETTSAVQTANIVRRVGSTVISVTGNPELKAGPRVQYRSGGVQHSGRAEEEICSPWAP